MTKMQVNNKFYGEIRDPLLGDILLYRHEFEIINTSNFQRLRGLRQLPGAELVYPSMTHTRFSHSLGVLGMAVRISTYSDLRLNDKNQKLLRLSALLHDIEEPPYYNAILHESFVTDELKKSVQRKKIKEIFEECEKKKVDLPLSSDEVIQVLQGDEKKYLRSIINCEIGANRLDYLQRDSYFCGVKYGYIDDRIFSSFHIIDDELVLKSEAIPIAEDILHNLYQMKVSVYDHKVVRSILTLVRDTFREGYQNHNFELDKIFDMTDEEFLQKLGPDIQRRIKNRKLPKLVYELNTFSLKNPSIIKNLDKLIREKEELLVNYIAKSSDFQPRDIRIEPVELRRVGDADPLTVMYTRKGWDEKTRSKRAFDLRPLQKSSKTIEEWSDFFYEQWRIFIFCYVGDMWDISRIDKMRETVASVCDRVLGFLKYSEFKKSALPEFKEMYNIYSKDDPKEIRKKIFNQSPLSKETLRIFEKKERLSTHELQKYLKCSRTTASLILNKLVQQNLLIKERHKREVYFHLPQNIKEILREDEILEPLVLN